MLLVPEELPYKGQLLVDLVRQNLAVGRCPRRVKTAKLLHGLLEELLVLLELLDQVLELSQGYRPTLDWLKPWVPRLV